jgi:hypothetical protein
MSRHRRLLSGLLTVTLLTPSATVFAAHPLMTDDTGTQGAGRFQLELNAEATSDEQDAGETEARETAAEVAATLSAGVRDNVDLVLGIPFLWDRYRERGSLVSEHSGVGDISLELKWRFYERGGLSFALKPGVTLPTGDEDRGLGNGRASYSLTFITTGESGPWALHMDLGYARNEFALEADREALRKDLWSASAAAEVEVAEGLRAVGNVGVERNPDMASNSHPAFVLVGIIYSVSENMDIDFGLKAGLSEPEADWTGLAGVSLRF